VDADTTVPTTLVGPNGTAPGQSFVQPQAKPVDDSTTGRGTGLPLALGALLLLVVFLAVLLRARRRRPGTPT
jgi:MYXO-CTERM domain-containing protein